MQCAFKRSFYLLFFIKLKVRRAQSVSLSLFKMYCVSRLLRRFLTLFDFLLLVFTAAGVASCDGRKMHPRTLSTVQIVSNLWTFEITDDILGR